MGKYPTYLLQHFQTLKNVGEISNPDGAGAACTISCGDIMQMIINCDANRFSEVTFKTFDCGAAIAASSILTEGIKGSKEESEMK